MTTTSPPPPIALKSSKSAGGVLIAAAALAALMRKGESPAICDCRFDLANPAAKRRAFDEAHIPGAFYLHLDDDLSGMKTGANGRHPLPPPDMLAEKLRACGAEKDKPLICYDELSGPFAARLWWLASRWLGFRQVKILDGGFAAWQAAGLPLSNLAPDKKPAERKPATKRQAAESAAIIADEFQTATIDEVARASAKNSATPLIDARRAKRYRGEVEPLDPRPGHIPGALNRCFEDNLTAQGFFKPPAQLRREFTSILPPSSAPIHYCGSGVTACHNIAAMTIAGLPAGKLYPGSWSEWCADTARPAALG